jgi:hypothetical protein
MHLQFHISFVPKWRGIELLRNSIDGILEAGQIDSDMREAISMVSTELMDNGYKHGLCEDTPINYELDILDGRVAVSVSNHFSQATEQNIEALNKAIAWIETYDNPLDAYIQKMKSLYNEEEPGASGLGLVRIVYEGQCSLSCQVDPENELLRVKADFLPREDNGRS